MKSIVEPFDVQSDLTRLDNTPVFLQDKLMTTSLGYLNIARCLIQKDSYKLHDKKLFEFAHDTLYVQ